MGIFIKTLNVRKVEIEQRLSAIEAELSAL